MCTVAGLGGIPPFSIISNYTAGDIERLRHIQLHETFPPEHIFNDAVVPSVELHKAWFDTLDAARYVKHYHFLYGFAMIIFWVAVVAVGAANRLMLAFLRLLQTHNLPSNSYGSEVSMWLKRKIILPATFGHKSATEVWYGTIPLRIQTLTIVVFTLLNIICSIYGYKITPVNLYFPTKGNQILRYVSDRTGIISFANFPIIWLFGMRNNFAIWLTGWDFGTYNNFHRWVARIATLQAVVHSIGYTIRIFQAGGWANFLSWWARMFWVAGEVATIVMCVLVACSIYWLRRQKYELFLILHIGMSVIILVTMLGHVSIFNGEYDSLFWVPVFIWIFDRALRVFRIFFFNPTLKPTVAAAIHSSSTNMVRLEIPCHFRAYKVKPGTYYYISIIDDKRFWESHPFTVASVSDGTASATKTLGEQIPLLETDSMEAEAEDEAEDRAAAKTNTSSKLLTFLIRPYDSFTGRLRDLAAAEWPRPASMRVLVDGPYGHCQPLHLFDHVVFVVGGSGVVVPMSYLKILTGSQRKSKSVQLHWAVREPEFAAELMSSDMSDAVTDRSFSVDLYFSAETERNISVEIPSTVSRHYRRPNAREIITAAAESAGQDSLAVVACGPARMADDARRAVIEAMDRGLCQIEYFEESFRW
ncbi:hypothetical protein QQS21_007955 [Conoideocrella luteorostrata]|uniref:FAD-binding FR-type domain-containing protein n=1 Tax=Conoideocrella luteorostrata TaxID=1105319 RepID=A0AAJ0CK24_9HYPO|nr:hypothetical protein QQS21_007955 [Conoideocrella luteorostrata]